jgi:hypothetical protein
VDGAGDRGRGNDPEHRLGKPDRLAPPAAKRTSQASASAVPAPKQIPLMAAIQIVSERSIVE